MNENPYINEIQFKETPSEEKTDDEEKKLRQRKKDRWIICVLIFILTVIVILSHTCSGHQDIAELSNGQWHTVTFDYKETKAAVNKRVECWQNGVSTRTIFTTSKQARVDVYAGLNFQGEVCLEIVGTKITHLVNFKSPELSKTNNQNK